MRSFLHLQPQNFPRNNIFKGPESYLDIVDPCGLVSGILHSQSGALLFPYHGVKRRGSDAQCVPAAGCSDAQTPNSTPSIAAYRFLCSSVSSSVFKRNFKGTCSACSCRACPSKQLSVPKTHHISFVFRDRQSAKKKPKKNEDASSAALQVEKNKVKRSKIPFSVSILH